jgi:hypothetical protein
MGAKVMWAHGPRIIFHAWRGKYCAAGILLDKYITQMIAQKDGKVQ